nr:RNA-directed DNA polymerase, eukaryota [Tanacetum cinerariifolium]
MEEYIRLEEEKARRHEKVFNWETATYGNIWDNKDVHNLGSIETEFHTLVFNDKVSSKTLSCEPTVSSLNNDEMDFKILFDESNNEDYTVIYDKNSFSYRIIYVNDLKTDLENDNEKVNMPLFPSPEPKVSCFDDLDFIKYFENKFTAIIYNDAQTSKSDLLTEPVLSPQHIDKFDLKEETSLSEHDEEEQNVLCFNDLFPFNVIYPDELKSDTDNDNDKIDIERSSGDISIKPLSDVINTNVGAYAQSLSSGKASILVNGSPTPEFHFHRGLKQGDHLAPFLFLLIMESLHLSFSRAVEAGIFTGFRVDHSITLSHLFYTDDAVFIGEWSHSNLKGIMNILRCFSLLSDMSINIQKSHLLGVGIPDNYVVEAAKSIGCSIMKAPFKYLGILV